MVDGIQAKRNEFIERIEKNISCLKNIFLMIHNQLHQKEATLIQQMEKIQKDTLDKFDTETIPKLTEIKQAQECIKNIISSNSNKEFMEKQVGEFNTEFENVVSQSGIQNLIELKWKIGPQQIDGMCLIIFKDQNDPIIAKSPQQLNVTFPSPIPQASGRCDLPPQPSYIRKPGSKRTKHTASHASFYSFTFLVTYFISFHFIS